MITAQEQAYASAALLQVAQAVVSLNDLDEILETIIRILPILVGVERAALYQWDAEKESFYPSEQYGLLMKKRTSFWIRSFAPGEFAVLDACRNSNSMMAGQLDPDSQRGFSPGCHWTQIRKQILAIPTRSCLRFPSR